MPGKKTKKVRAWANVTKRGRIDPNFISSCRMLIASRGRSSARFKDKPVRGTFTVDKP